jgi:hypothetical protein
MKESYLYCFYIPDINAIKVGYGADGQQRMRQYSSQYSLSAEIESFRKWSLPSSGVASTIESACHDALVGAGFRRLERVVDESQARELFELGATSYNDAVLLVTEAIDDTVSKLVAALNTTKPLQHEKKLQATARIKAQKELDTERQVREIASLIQGRWEDSYGPFIKVVLKASKIREKFIWPPDQPLWKKILHGRGKHDYMAEVLAMFNWEHWSELRSTVPEILWAGREAWELYAEIHHNYDDTDLYTHSCLEQAQKLAGFNLWTPLDHLIEGSMINPPFNQLTPYSVSYSYHGQDVPVSEGYMEVCLCVSIATEWGTIESANILELDSVLKGLVTNADTHMHLKSRI